jgi:phenylalanyl-tRNA synthetase beta subunit
MNLKNGLLLEIQFVDVYRNKELLERKKKSVSMHLIFRHSERLLSAEEINSIIEDMLKKFA